MAVPANDMHNTYARYAAQCLNDMNETKDEGSRSIQHEMATEWLRLADAVLHPLKRSK
jgi:hypothetical protein